MLTLLEMLGLYRMVSQKSTSFKSMDLSDNQRLITDKLHDTIVNIKHSLTDAEMSVIYSKDKSVLFIIFEGSNSIIDWIHNVQFHQVPISIPSGESMMVHSGFYKQFNALLIHIQYYVEIFLNSSNSKSIVFGGFSLGGALALMAGAWVKSTCLSESYNMSVEIHTAAAPKCGDKVFATWCDDNLKLTRITHPLDPVVKSPFLPNYAHPKNNEITIKIKQPTRINFLCCFSPCIEYCFETNVKYHSINEYSNMVKKLT